MRERLTAVSKYFPGKRGRNTTRPRSSTCKLTRPSSYSLKHVASGLATARFLIVSLVPVPPKMALGIGRIYTKILWIAVLVEISVSETNVVPAQASARRQDGRPLQKSPTVRLSAPFPGQPPIPKPGPPAKPPGSSSYGSYRPPLLPKGTGRSYVSPYSPGPPSPGTYSGQYGPAEQNGYGPSYGQPAGESYHPPGGHTSYSGCGGGGGEGYGYGGGGCCSGGVDPGDPCYSKSPDCVIVNAQPYERHSSLSLDECRSTCTRSVASAAPAIQCRSFVFDHVNNVCDLFGHVGNLPPSKLVPCLGRAYYEAVGDANCGQTTTTTTATTAAPLPTPAPIIPTIETTAPTSPVVSTPGPAVSPCPSGQVARYMRVPQYQTAGGSSAAQSAGSSVQSCIDACEKGQTDTGQSFSCNSFDYSNGQCTFYSAATPPAAMAAGLTPSQGSEHVDVICLDSSLAQNCPGPFERYPQMLLVGFAEVVTDASDFSDCLKKCLNSQSTFSISCMSAEFYYKESINNCILNIETKDSHPGMFAKEKQNTVDYFQLNCQGAASNATVPAGTRFALLKKASQRKPGSSGRLLVGAKTEETDDASIKIVKTNRASGKVQKEQPSIVEWTEWSGCDREKDGKRIRYQRCGTASPKECPFQSEWCNTRAKEDTSEAAGVSNR